MIEGNAAEDGPAPPLCCFGDDGADAMEVDCSLSWDARLLRVLEGVPVREVVLDPRPSVSLVSLSCLVNVLTALRGSAIRL